MPASEFSANTLSVIMLMSPSRTYMPRALEAIMQSVISGEAPLIT
jgi:hypothetical protein